MRSISDETWLDKLLQRVEYVKIAVLGSPQCVLVRRWGVSPETDPSHEPHPLMNPLCVPRLGECKVHCLVDSAALPIEASALGFVVGNSNV